MAPRASQRGREKNSVNANKHEGATPCYAIQLGAIETNAVVIIFMRYVMIEKKAIEPQYQRRGRLETFSGLILGYLVGTTVYLDLGVPHNIHIIRKQRYRVRATTKALCVAV